MSGTVQQPNPYMQNLAMFGNAGQPQQNPYQVGMTALNMANNGGMPAMPQGLHPQIAALLQSIFSQPNMGAKAAAPVAQNPYPNGAPTPQSVAAQTPAPAADPVKDFALSFGGSGSGGST